MADQPSDPIKKIIDFSNDEENISLGPDICNKDCDDCRKVLYSGETYFIVRRKRSRYMRKNDNEKLTAPHIDQTVKHLLKMLWRCFSYSGTGYLVSIEGGMNKKIQRDLMTQKLEIEVKKVEKVDKDHAFMNKI